MRSLSIDQTMVAEEGSIMGPVGCENCRNAEDIRGRIGIFEIFQVDDEVRHLINQDLSTPQLASAGPGSWECAPCERTVFVKSSLG